MGISESHLPNKVFTCEKERKIISHFSSWKLSINMVLNNLMFIWNYPATERCCLPTGGCILGHSLPSCSWEGWWHEDAWNFTPCSRNFNSRKRWKSKVRWKRNQNLKIKTTWQLKEVSEHLFSVRVLVPPLIWVERWEFVQNRETLTSFPALCLNWGLKYCRHKISIEPGQKWSTVTLVCKLLENKKAILKLSTRKLL